MKTLVVLASVMVFLSLAVPKKIEAQKRRVARIIEHTTPEISWVKTSFPSGVDIFTADLAINSSGHIFVGTGNGIFRSMDNGANWIPIDNGLKPNSSGTRTVFALAINSSGHIFAAVWSQIYLSIDNGNTWTQQSAFSSGDGAYVLAINSSGYIFAGTGEGIYRSTDSGVTWTAKNQGLISEGDDRNGVHAIAINSKGDIFAGAFDGVYRSTDNGDNWTQKLGDASNNAFVLAISPNGSVFTQLSSNQPRPTGDEGIYRSTDNGNKWTRMKKDADVIVINSSGHIFLGTLGTTAGVYRSMDNGISWTNISKGLVLSKGNLTDKRVSALAVSPSGTIFAVTPAGIYRSK